MIEPMLSVGARSALDRLGEVYGVTPASLAPAAAMPAETAAAEPPGFGQVLAAISGSAVSRLENAETLSIARMSGEDVPIRDVVSAVMDAEQSLSAAIAIRDKIVQAYLEISRMQI